MKDYHRPQLLFQIFILPLVVILSLTSALTAQEQPVIPADSIIHIPAPTSNVVAVDYVYDRGETVELTWNLSPDDTIGGRIDGYELARVEQSTGKMDTLEVIPAGISYYKDDKLTHGHKYAYLIRSVYFGAKSSPVSSNIITPSIEIINWRLANLFAIAFILCGSVIYFIAHAKKGKKLFIRKIAGLEAIDEAIGRATEMGRPILFVPGINDMDDVQTIAGITLLSRVAKVVADYDIRINMPVSRSLVMTTARETIKEAYIGAGRPDAYNDDMVRYITDEQFGYVAAVDGIMVRDKPATCFYLGAFFAESLILAETGNSIGAIQIAGTAQPAQLPFFVAACDYTLIGEELFAASAYLSNEPKQLGSLKGQDVGKFVAMIAIVIGVLIATLAELTGSSSLENLSEFMNRLFTIVS